MSLINSTEQQPARGPTPSSWRPGQSGNPRGRPRKGNALAEMVREAADPREMVERALTIMRSDDDARALAALQWLRDSGYVKPAERHEVAAVMGGTRDEDDRDLDGLDAAQLRELLAAEREYEARRAAIVGQTLTPLLTDGK